VNRVPLDIALSGWWRRVFCLFVLAFIIRGVFILTLRDGFYFPDSVDYSRAAVSLIVDGEFGETYRRSPGYPLFLAGIYGLVGEKIVAVRLVEAFLGACLVVVIAIIAQRIAGDQVGALAGLLWSIYPMGVFIVGLVYPTNVATLLLACAMLCLVTTAEEGLAPGRVIVGGILFGLAALTVPVVLATILTITFWIVYWQRRRRLLLISIFLLGAALPLTPWTIRNFYMYDRLVIIEPRLAKHLPSIGEAQSVGNAQSMGNAPQEAKGRRGGEKIKAILENFSLFTARVVRQFGHFWELQPTRIRMDRPNVRTRMHERDSRVVKEAVFDTSWTSLVSLLSVGPIFLFALIGTSAMSLHKQRRPALSLLCITILSFAISYSFFVSKTRYRIPVEPYIFILSAYGLRHIWLALMRRFVREPLPDGELI
jgi:4-amino-4-deoxy-L-arabinose transferase-like glycosyltransferase